MLLVKIAGGLVLVVLIAAFFLRGRGGVARPKSPASVRPTPPPSPYKPSRGFRILDGSETDAPHQVQRPRLDPNKEFVFNDPLASPSETASLPHLRHDERWALERSSRRAPHPHVRRRRWAWVLLVAVLIAGLIAVLLISQHPARHRPALASAYAVAPSSWMR
ncbi:MAG: hypothetical protein HIU57_00230 [Acidobacteria bacterium]|nr:hypothetical protein [Acidobacteriota bacterium]